MKRSRGKQQNGKDQRSLKKIGDIKETFHARMDTINDRNSKDLTQAEEIKKKWQEYTKELWTEVCNIVQEVVIKTNPKKKKCQKAKWPYKQLRKEEK